MPRSVKETSITIGVYQVPVSAFKAAQNTELDLKSLCDCEKAPRQMIVCENPECGAPLDEKAAVEAMKLGKHLVVDSGGCVREARRFQAWKDTPKRGYEWTRGEYIVVPTEKVKEAKASVKYDTIEVSKTVDFKKLATTYVLGEPLYLLPPEKANTVTRKAFNIIVEALDQGGMAFLAYMTNKERTYRYAIVADKAQNVLMAYQMDEKRPLPYDVPKETVSAKETASVTALLQASYDADATLAPVPDPLLEMLSQLVEASEKLPGIGQPTLIPQ